MSKSSYSYSAKDLLITNIPTFNQNETVAQVVEKLSKGNWDDIYITCVLGDEKKFLGYVETAKILSAKSDQLILNLIEKPKVVIHPNESQQKIAVEAVKNDLKSIPVVDEDKNLLGIITAEKIIDILHIEHLDDILRFSGIRRKGFGIVDFITASVWDLIKSRLPWLVIGLSVGFLISLTTSRFENSLRENISLVFFIPIITYMSDAIGTQTETIFVRALTYSKINVLNYIIKELILGMLMGFVLGVLTGIFGFILSDSINIGLVVGISLFLSMSIAAVLACLTPTVLKMLDKDPAVGSGPLKTAIQDFVSVVVYLVIAVIIL